MKQWVKYILGSCFALLTVLIAINTTVSVASFDQSLPAKTTDQAEDCVLSGEEFPAILFTENSASAIPGNSNSYRTNRDNSNSGHTIVPCIAIKKISTDTKLQGYTLLSENNRVHNNTEEKNHILRYVYALRRIRI